MAVEPSFALVIPEPRPKKDGRGYLLLPKPLKERARAYAHKRGLSFNDLVVQLLERTVGEEAA